MTTTQVAQIQLRSGTASQWSTANPVLAQGEPGWTTDTRIGKVGDGTTAWNALATAWQGDLSTVLAGKVAVSIVDVKGDLIVATGADAVARLAAGADNKILAADSTQSTGLKWTSPTGVLLASGTVSGAANIISDGKLTSAFKTYELEWVGAGSADDTLRMALRASGADNTAASYGNLGTAQSIGTPTPGGSAGAGQTSAWVGRNMSSGTNRSLITLISPQEARHTLWIVDSVSETDTVYWTSVRGAFAANTQFDGFKLYPNSGTLTGSWKLTGIPWS